MPVRFERVSYAVSFDRFTMARDCEQIMELAGMIYSGHGMSGCKPKAVGQLAPVRGLGLAASLSFEHRSGLSDL